MLTWRLPILQLIYNPAAAFRRFQEDKPFEVTLGLFVTMLAVSAMKFTPGTQELQKLASITEKFPALGSPHVLAAGICTWLIVGTLLWASCAHLAAHAFDGQSGFLPFLMCSLFLTSVFGLVSPFTIKFVAVRWGLALWQMVLTGVMLSSVYQLPAGKAIAAYLLSWIGEMAVFFVLLMLAIIPLTHSKLLGKMLSAPELTRVHMPANYDWVLQTPEGKNTKFTDMKGKVVVLNVWATWCAPCRAEMPSLEKLYQQMDPDHMTVVGISQETPEVVKAFILKNHYTFPMYVRRNDLPPLFQSQAIPSTYVISPDGYVVAKHESAAVWDGPTILTYLKNLVNTPTAPGDYSYGMDLQHTAALLVNQGDFNYRHGSYDAAENYLKQALAYSIKDRGPESSGVVASYNALGNVYNGRGNFASALVYYQKAATLSVKVPGVSITDQTTILQNLAKLYRKMNRPKDAYKTESQIKLLH